MRWRTALQAAGVDHQIGADIQRDIWEKMTFPAIFAGLRALMFFSERRGYDERAHEADRTHADHWRQPDQD